MPVSAHRHPSFHRACPGGVGRDEMGLDEPQRPSLHPASTQVTLAKLSLVHFRSGQEKIKITLLLKQVLQ